MNKNFTFKLLGLLLFPVFCYAQINPRMVNRKYAKTVYLEDFSSSQTFSNNWTASYCTKDNSLYSFVDASTTVALDETNGELRLNMLKIPGGYTNSYWEGTFITDFITGEVTSNSYFGYGVYQCNALFAYDKGSFPAFWLYNDSQCAVSKRNEIDIVECKVNHSGPTLDNNMFYYPTNCGSSISIGFEDHQFNTWNQPHVFECVYAPDRTEFWVDDALYHTVWNNGDYKYPDQTMKLILSQQVVRYNGGQSEIATPQTSTFYWVKAKEFFLAPEITCPQIICSSATATMDVDPAATNITWSLSPSNLFSGLTSGTGKSVNIYPSSSQGKGKITYTFRMPITMAPYYETFTAEKEIWIKGPDPSETSFDVYRSDGVRATKVGNTFLMCPNTTYHIYAMNSGPVPLSNYTWTIPSAWTRNYTSGNIISVYTNSSPGGQVTVNATNTASGCNNTVQVVTGYMGSNTSCGSYYMALSPNPSTGETAITLSADGEKVVNEKTSWDLLVFDQFQALKEKKTKLNGKEAKINTSGWKDGVYIVNAIIDGQKVSEKLVVKH